MNKNSLRLYHHTTSIGVDNMKKMLIYCMIFLNTVVPTKASNIEGETVLMYSSELPMIFLLTPGHSNRVQIISVPINTMFPISCANGLPATLSTVTTENMASCLAQTLTSSLQIDITYTVYLDIKTIDHDYALSLNASHLKNFDDLQIYFGELSKKLQLSILWKYSTYIKTNIQVWDLPKYYHLYTAKDIDIHYHFLNLIGLDQKWYPIDKTIYPTSIM